MNRHRAIPAGVFLVATAVGTLGPLHVRAATPQDPQLPQGFVADAVTLEVISGATVTLVTTGSVTQSGPDGSFGFPEVSPGRTSLRIEAPGYQRTLWEGEVVPDRPAPIEVLLSRPQDPGTLRVVVRAGDSGDPLAGAAVSIPELGVSTATDRTGAIFVPGVPPGSFRVLVSSVGYASLDSSVELEDGSIALEVALSSSPIPLEPVVVEAESDFNQRLEMAGFYERRAMGLGQFLDRADIERASPTMPSELFRLMPGVQLIAGGSATDTPDFGLFGRRGFTGFRTPERPTDVGCRMQLFIDGTLHRMEPVVGIDGVTFESEFQAAGVTIDRLMPVEWIEAIEVYTSTSRVPAQFNAPGAQCGVVVLWTRGSDITTPSRPLGVFEEVVQPGDDVRIASELASGRFRVAVAAIGGLIVRTDAASESIVVPGSAITSLEVSLGRSVSPRRGLVLGGVAGALGGMIVFATCHRPRFEDDRCLGGASPEASAAMSVGLGAVIGLVVSWASDEVWAVGRLPIDRQAAVRTEIAD